jgi:MFS transporter, UMF1 family
MLEKNNKKLINAWCMYDWANSVYSLTITTAILPEYFLWATENPANGHVVNFLGFNVVNSALWSFSLSFAFLLAAALSPLLTSIADYTGRKKMFMRIFCYIGAASCSYLFFFTKDNITLSVIAFILAGVGFSGSIVFYNSFLPEITTDEQMDKVSARGFTFGYIGSILLLLFNLSMILFPELFFNVSQKVMELMQSENLQQDQALDQARGYYVSIASRISFLSVGIWWFVFAQYSFYYLPSNVYKKEATGNWIFNGFKELKKVIAELKWQKLLKRFLLAFFFYNMGVQTVMYVATIFGKKELHLKTAELITVVLILQIIAIVGAMVFAKVSAKYGNIKALGLCIIIWLFICFGAYFVETGNQFYGIAVVVGFVMGGVQSLSRSTYSKLIPKDTIDHASYFSFYDVCDKLSVVLGTLMFGLVDQVTKDMRNSIIVLGVLFVIGLIFLAGIPSKNSYDIKKEI